MTISMLTVSLQLSLNNDVIVNADFQQATSFSSVSDFNDGQPFTSGFLVNTTLDCVFDSARIYLNLRKAIVIGKVCEFMSLIRLQAQ